MSVKQVLELFGKRVQQQSKSNLSKRGKKDTSDLYDSIGYELKVSKNSFHLSFTMTDYGKFVDKGVKGSKSSAKAPNSPYKYTDKMPPTKAFDKWIIRRGFAPRDKGKFRSREGLKFAIAKKIFEEGIETTNFFTTPFENEFKKLPEQVVEAYGLEVNQLLTHVFKQ